MRAIVLAHLEFLRGDSYWILFLGVGKEGVLVRSGNWQTERNFAVSAFVCSDRRETCHEQSVSVIFRSSGWTRSDVRIIQRNRNAKADKKLKQK